MSNFCRNLLLTLPLVTAFATAQNNDLHILISNGVKAATEELLPPVAASLKRQASTQYGATAVLKKAILDGAAFDAAVLTTDAIDDLVKQGKIVAASRVGVARIGLGLGVRAGAAKPDIRTPEALRRTLLAAKSITFNPNGATVSFINKMFMQLGIAGEMKSKLTPQAESERSQKDVAEGKAEIIVTLIPEVTSVAGVQLVGPLPDAVQGHINFSAGVAVGSKNAGAAAALIQALTGPKVAPVLKSKGMEPRS